MRRTLRLLFVCPCLAAVVALSTSAAAQETRGKISGTVRDSDGVVPGASVKITNTDMNVTKTVTTNESGYFEAPLLIPGSYAVSVQMPGYKSVDAQRHRRSASAKQLTVPFTLEVGQISEEILVTADTPLLDTSVAVIVGRQLRQRVWSRACRCSRTCRSRWRASRRARTSTMQQTQVSQGYVDNTSLSAGSGLGLPLGGTQPTPPSFGGNNYTLDGANNNGSSRRIAASPNSDMIQEMRVESSNFDAASRSRPRPADFDDDARRHQHSSAAPSTIRYLDEQSQFADRTAEAHLRRSRQGRVRQGTLAQPLA